MPDWPEYVRQHLRLSGFCPGREAAIIEEVARQMEDAYAEALRMGASDAPAGEIARRHVSDWQALANSLADAHHGKEPIMAAWQQRTEDREFDIRGKLSWLTGWRRDVIYGLRLLAKNPGFAAVAVLTLALCIGANTAIFSIVNAVMFKALPVRDPNHPMLLEWTMRSGPKLHSHSSYGDCDNQRQGASQHGCSLSKPFLDEVREHGPFSSLAEFAGGGSLTVSGIGGVHRASPQYVSGDYFRALGVGAALGRVLIPADDKPGAPAVVVLTYGYWQRQLGADRSIAARLMDTNPVTVPRVFSDIRKSSRLSPTSSSLPHRGLRTLRRPNSSSLVDEWVSKNSCFRLSARRKAVRAFAPVYQKSASCPTVPPISRHAPPVACVDHSSAIR